MPTEENATPEVIAQRMLGKLERDQRLDQADAVSEIAERFGPEFTYERTGTRPSTGES